MNNLDLMYKRLDPAVGGLQQEKMIKDKRKTLDRVLLYSYQGARVSKVDSNDIELALINPNQVKQDYDDKIISIGYEYDYKPGTVFEWLNTGTKWLVYLQDLTELAYFKGDIRKCSYEIRWKSADGALKSTYAAIKGPSEKGISSAEKGGISLDSPNYSLNILIPKNEDTLTQFKRYTEFYLNPLEKGDTQICWRVEAVDTISMPGIIEVNAVEYYSNKDEDDLEQGIVEGLIIEEMPEPASCVIKGETFIKPKIPYTYTYEGEEEGKWSIKTDGKQSPPITTTVNGKEITLIWTKTYTGQFVLQYGTEQKTIVVESLF